VAPKIVVDKPAGLTKSLVALLASEQDRTGRLSLALSGGSVATTFFPALAASPIDWTRVAFFWGDERAVAETHPDSNVGLARRLWLGPARVPEANVHPIRAEGPDLAQAAAAYAHVLTRELGTPPRLDVALLGVGPDGHVCSLFPGHSALDATGWTAAVSDAPKPPPRRVTLTMATLHAAGRTILVATGAGKAAVVRDALRDARSDLPFARVLRRGGSTVLLLDEDAGALVR
jgi:6-phosphogluconolactonase